MSSYAAPTPVVSPSPESVESTHLPLVHPPIQFHYNRRLRALVAAAPSTVSPISPPVDVATKVPSHTTLFVTVPLWHHLTVLLQLAPILLASLSQVPTERQFGFLSGRRL